MLGFLFFSVGRIDEKSLIGNMAGSDLDSSLEDDDDDDSDSVLNEVLADEDNIDALYDVAHGVNVRKSARPKIYQSDEDF